MAQGFHQRLKDSVLSERPSGRNAAVNVNIRCRHFPTRLITNGEKKAVDAILSGAKVVEQRTVNGADLRNPQIYASDFLIEVYFKTAAERPGPLTAPLWAQVNR
jgi:hypothetical protein